MAHRPTLYKQRRRFRGSEDQLHPELHLASGVRSSNQAEGRTLEEARPAQNRRVGDVDELSPRLQAGSLAQDKTLRQSEIGGCESRTAE